MVFVLRPLQGYFTILWVKANIVQQITQRRHLESKTGIDNYLFFFCGFGFTAPSGLFHYLKGKKKITVQQINKRGILSPKTE